MNETEMGVEREATKAPPVPTPEPRAKPIQERTFLGTGVFWGLVVGILVAVGLVILAAQNTASTTIAFLGWEFSTPLIVVILGTLLGAVILDELFGLVYRARRRRTLTDRHRLEEIEATGAKTD